MRVRASQGAHSNNLAVANGSARERPASLDASKGDRTSGMALAERGTGNAREALPFACEPSLAHWDRCIMKSIVLAASFCLLLTPSAARAELADALAATSVEYYPSAKNGDRPGETQINVLRTSAGVPIPLSDDTKLIAGASYELIDVRPSASDAFQLHAPKVTLGVSQAFSKHWGLIALGDAGFASDFSEAMSSEDVLLSLTGIATYSFSDALQLGAGAVYDRRTGKLLPLPAVLLDLRLSGRVRIHGFAPVWLNADFRATDWLDVGIRSTFEGNRFHVGERVFGMKDIELAYSNLTVGPKVTFNFGAWLHLDVYAAGAVYRRYELFQNDDSVARYELSPVIGYGARFWVAPSAW